MLCLQDGVLALLASLPARLFSPWRQHHPDISDLALSYCGALAPTPLRHVLTVLLWHDARRT